MHDPRTSEEPPRTDGDTVTGEAAVPYATIVDILSTAPDVRTELVHDLREQINRDGYMSDEKLNLAIYQLLKDVFR